MTPVNEYLVLLAVGIWLPLACGVQVAGYRLEGARASAWDLIDLPVFGALTMVMAGSLRLSFSAAMASMAAVVAWIAADIAVGVVRRSRGLRPRRLKEYDGAVRGRLLALAVFGGAAWVGCVYLAGLGGRLWN